MYWRTNKKGQHYRRKVQKVIDGDTFKVRKRVAGSQYIRIAGIDCPEKGQRGFGTAKSRLSRLTGKTVTLNPVGKSYGRTVADVSYKRKKVRPC